MTSVGLKVSHSRAIYILEFGCLNPHTFKYIDRGDTATRKLTTNMIRDVKCLFKMDHGVTDNYYWMVISIGMLVLYKPKIFQPK